MQTKRYETLVDKHREEILAAEASFDFEPLIEKAVRETEVKQFKYGVRNVDLDM